MSEKGSRRHKKIDFDTFPDRGWFRLSHAAMEEDLRKKFPEALLIDGYVYSPDFLGRMEVEIGKKSSDPEGCDLAELSGECGLSRAALKPLLGHLEKAGKGVLKKSRFYGGTNFRLREISPFDRGNLEFLEQAGAEGVETTRVKMQGLQESLEVLVKKSFAVALTETLFWHVDVLAEKRRELMEGLQCGDRLTIGDAREKTGLSRRFLLPLFASLEADGCLRREEDERVVTALLP